MAHFPRRSAGGLRVAFRTHAQLGGRTGNFAAHGGPRCTAFGPTAFNRGAQCGGPTLECGPAFSSVISRRYVEFGADRCSGRRAAHLANPAVGLRHSLCGGSSSLGIGGVKTTLDSTGSCWASSVDKIRPLCCPGDVGVASCELHQRPIEPD